MKRAAIYARFSTDLQNEKSVEDQIDLCRTYAQREDLVVVSEYFDRARSGGSIFGREGLLALLDAAAARKFDVIVVEALDRLSRDMEDLAGIHKRMTFLDIEIRAVHEGVANTVLVGLRGLVGQLYREDNVHKVRRGMGGLIKAGKHAGGRAYGYTPDPQATNGLVIVPDEAEVVTRIFTEYAEGRSPRAICYDLNDEGVRPPRGGRWNASALNGNGQRGSGILNNRIYAGQIVWNKVRMVKDPSTGKRLSRPNPEKDWLTCDAPELRIIPQDLWDRVHRRMPKRENRPEQSRRPKRLLSGLLRCGACGAGMSTNGKDRTGRTRVRCSAHSESGTCPDPKTYYLDLIENEVVQLLLKEMQDPKHATLFIETYIAERKKLLKQALSQKTRLERRHAQLGREIERVIDMMLASDRTRPELITRMDKLGEERDEVARQIEESDAEIPSIELHPAALKRYGDVMRDLLTQMDSGAGVHDSGVQDAVRELVSKVTVFPGATKGTVRVTIEGFLQAIIGAPVWGTMVAEDRSGRYPHSVPQAFLLRTDPQSQSANKTLRFCIES